MDDVVDHFLQSRGCSPKVIEGGVPYLLARWRWLSEFIIREAGYHRGIDEYRNDLSSRTILSEVIKVVQTEQRELIEAELRSIDEQFRSVTNPIGYSVSRDDSSDRWWLFRLPPGVNVPGVSRQE